MCHGFKNAAEWQRLMIAPRLGRSTGPAGALAATTPVAIDLATSVQALPIILSGQPGCNLPPPPSLFGPGPETYSHGQASVTTGATGNHVLEIVGLAVAAD